MYRILARGGGALTQKLPVRARHGVKNWTSCRALTGNFWVSGGGGAGGGGGGGGGGGWVGGGGQPVALGPWGGG